MSAAGILLTCLGKACYSSPPLSTSRFRAKRRGDRISRGEIEEMLPGKVSVMPAGLDKQLSLQELADIVEFLRNCK